MNGRFLNKVIVLLFFLSLFHVRAQDVSNKLFADSDLTQTTEQLLTLRLQVQIKTLRKETNDSTYIPSTLYYKPISNWDSVPVELRTRGEFRLKKCVFPPVKLKFKKKNIEETVFEGNKKLKLVVPCRHEDSKNDYVVREFMAYKLYEPVTPYHFETRLINLDWSQKASKKDNSYKLKGILLEDIDNLAKRVGGNEYDRKIHPMRLDTLNGIRNAFFQYMIGNNDYSVVLGHNRKGLYVNEKFVIIPYDFDLAGLVNADYGKSSDVQNLRFMGDQPAERIYRDSPRNRKMMDQVRQEYIDLKPVMLETMNSIEKYFDNKDDFVEAEMYVLRFYQILEDDKKFEKQFVKQSKSY